MKNHTVVLTVIGFFFIIFGTFAMDYAIYRHEPSWVWWFCYVGMIIIGFGLVYKIPKLIISQLYILTIPLIIWLTDFSYTFITGQKLWGVTSYFFSKDLLLSARIVALEHFFLLPLAYLSLYFIIGQEKIKNAWVISLVQISIIYLIVKFLTDGTQNVNCVIKSCFPYVPSDNIYPLRWFLIYISMIFITKFTLDLIIYLKNRK